MRYDLQIAEMTWSYSRLTTFENCPYSWLLKYIYHIKSGTKFFSEYGTFCHELLAGYFSGKITEETIYRRYLTGYRKNVKTPAPNEKIANSYFQSGRDYFRQFSPPQGRTVLETEEKSEFIVAGYPFIGFIDLVTEDDRGKLYITDHKSHNLKPRSIRKHPTQSDRELDNYLRQLYLYSIPVHNRYGRCPDFLEFNCFRTGVWITEPFSEARLDEVIRWAKERIETITKTNKWNPCVDDWFCRYLCDSEEYCEVRH